LKAKIADIKLIMDNPDLDQNGVLAKQREMLCLKKQRLERIIANLDNMLKGAMIWTLPYLMKRNFKLCFQTCCRI
jgi:hypothetical protein